MTSSFTLSQSVFGHCRILLGSLTFGMMVSVVSTTTVSWSDIPGMTVMFLINDGLLEKKRSSVASLCVGSSWSCWNSFSSMTSKVSRTSLCCCSWEGLPGFPSIVRPQDLYSFTQWGRVTHICVGKLTIIGSDNGLSPGRRHAIIWTNAGILLIGPLGTNFSEILIAIEILSFKKMHLKISPAKWRPFCLGLNVLSGKTSYARPRGVCLGLNVLSGKTSYGRPPEVSKPRDAGFRLFQSLWNLVCISAAVLRDAFKIV